MLISLAVVAALVPAGASQAQDQAKDQVVMVEGADAEMNAAIAEARRTLPVFWRKFDEGKAEAYSLKVGLPAAHGGLEHIWVDGIVRKGDVITAHISDDPRDLPNLTNGSEITVDPARISDWGYIVDGRRYGCFTTRVLIKRLPPDEMARYSAMLHPTALEPDAR
jgi:uncharacterized protein YegJ (DUF2314 family)